MVQRVYRFGILAWFACAWVATTTGLPAAADDSDLFSTAVPPNVVLLVDNSGSMTHMVWHPAYDPASATNSCNVFNDASTYWLSGNWKGTYCSKTITLYKDPAISGSVRYSGHYLNWLWSTQSNAYNTDIESGSNGTYSSCVGGGTYSKYRRTRVTAAKDVLREVICQVNAAGAVRFGLAQFRRPGINSDTHGGYIRVPAEDYLDAGGNPNTYALNGSTQSHGDHLDDAIDGLTGESWTPLAEALFQVYTYFMSRTGSEIPDGQNGSSFPKYSFTTSWSSGDGGPYSAAGAPTVPASPVQYDCQKNFVVIITDGEPTKDNFTTNSSSDDLDFNQFTGLIGDYNPDGEVEAAGWCCDGTRYLDDVAKFMHDTDFRPVDLDEDQTIDVYTVGFTTSPFANAILEKTADVGGGSFYFSTDPEALAQDIVNVVTDIIRKSQSFTAAAIPATRTADGGMFYVSSFIPESDSGYWTGSLEAWKMLANGDVLGLGDICALNDADVGECNDGPFIDAVDPFWEAADNVPGPTSRNLTVSLDGRKRPFKHDLLSGGANASEVFAADLGVTFPPAQTYTGSIATSDEELAAEVVANVRGCTFGTGANGVTCIPRSHLLGDIFHSAPVVIPKPSAFINEASYSAFASSWYDRQRMVVAGANDGFLRAFDGGALNTSVTPHRYFVGSGAEQSGFMPYAVRNNAKEIALDGNSRDYYFVDATPQVADVWFPTASDGRQSAKNPNGSEWQTVLIGGLRQGGNTYYALDVTDPSHTDYPNYLWEFPREDGSAGTGAAAPYMGQTWSEAVITKIRVKVDGDDNFGMGYERWVAVFGAGYSPESDPNAHATYDPTATAGRAIIILDVQSGEILAMKKFDSASIYPEEREMLYSFASSLGVYDSDFDGYADLIYAPDLGGNVWKWVIKDLGDDIVNGSLGTEEQTQWSFTKFFEAPVYDSGTAKYYKSFYHAPSATFYNGTLWLAMGSGERMNLPFAGFASTDEENNRVYSMTDTDPYEILPTPNPTLYETDLYDHTNTSNCVDTTRGFYFVAVDGEKFITQSDIFFYYVLIASYEPVPPASPCESSGNAYLYGFKVFCGEGLFETAGTDEHKILIGDDPPVDPVISIGDEPDVIIKNGDEIVDPDPEFGKIKTSGQALWREVD